MSRNCNFYFCQSWTLKSKISGKCAYFADRLKGLFLLSFKTNTGSCQERGGGFWCMEVINVGTDQDRSLASSVPVWSMKWMSKGQNPPLEKWEPWMGGGHIYFFGCSKICKCHKVRQEINIYKHPKKIKKRTCDISDFIIQ